MAQITRKKVAKKTKEQQYIELQKIMVSLLDLNEG